MKKVLCFIWGLVFMNNNLYCRIQKEVLPNGITFIHNLNTEQPVVCTIVFLKMGSIYEPKKFAGISELLQSTIIKGTKNRSAYQIAEEIESLGGSISADSDDDYSTISVAVGSQHFEKSIEILSDIFFNPIFPENEVEKEKLNIIAGILARKDNIFNVAIDELLFNLYGKNHPYGRRPLSIIKTVKKLNRKHLFSWWEKFYGVDKESNNIVIVTSGNVDFQKAKEVITKYFSEVKSVKLPEIIGNEFKIKRRYVKKKVHFKQGYLMYGYYIPPLLNKEKINEHISMKILANYLGGGMSSKLFEILREKSSLCYETNCFYPTKYLSSHFVIYLGFDYDRINLAKKEIDNIIQQILDDKLLTEQELNEVKSKMKGRFLLDHQTNLRQAWYLGFWEIMGLGYDYDFKYLTDIDTVSLEEVRKNVKKFLHTQCDNHTQCGNRTQCVIVELVPKK